MELNISTDYLAKQKLFIGTPCYGGICYGTYAKCIADLSAVCQHFGIQLQIYMLFNESLITRARNYTVDEFMRCVDKAVAGTPSPDGDPTKAIPPDPDAVDNYHLLFIDSDIGFDPSFIIQMLALQNKESPYDIIGAAYPKKTISWEKIKMAVDKGFADDDKGGPENLNKFLGDYVFNPKAGQQQIPIGEPCEVLEIGTGFMMVKPRALMKFRDLHPELLYRPDHVRTEHFDGSRQITQYFQAEIDQLDFRTFYENELKKLLDDQIEINPTVLANILAKATEINSKKSNRYLSEDYWFCQKCQEIDLKTWICPWMALNHTGSQVFGGSLSDIAALGANPTADVAELNKHKGKK